MNGFDTGLHFGNRAQCLVGSKNSLITLKKDIVDCLDIYLLLFYGACAEAVTHFFLCLLTRVPKMPEMLF